MTAQPAPCKKAFGIAWIADGIDVRSVGIDVKRTLGGVVEIPLLVSDLVTT